MKTFFALVLISVASLLQIDRPKNFAERDIDNFFQKLPKADKTVQIDTTYDNEVLNKELLEFDGFKSLLFKAPDIEKILGRKLVYEGDSILEMQHPSANGRVAFVTCYNGMKAIIYATKPSKKIAPAVFAFFREHEFGHIKNKHVVCGCQNKQTDLIKNEFIADCEAVKSLEAFGEDGVGVIHRTVSTLWVLNTQETSTHPRSKDRANAIDTKCE